MQNYVNKTCDKRQGHDRKIGDEGMEYEGTWILMKHPFKQMVRPMLVATPAKKRGGFIK